MTGFENLDVWKEGCRLAVAVYSATKSCKDVGLRDQLQRSAVSISSNIAEGSERRSGKEFIQFLYIAKGSAAELRTQLYIAAKIGVIDNGTAKALAGDARRISAMLQNLISSLHP